MKSTLKYIHCDECHSAGMYFMYFNVLLAPVLSEKTSFSRARGIRKYIEVHKVHPDQIRAPQKKYIPSLAVAS